MIADGEPLNLRNRFVAAILAWLIPGAGHYYQRRYLKSAIFFVCIISSFLIGIFVADMKCVYASWDGTEKRWQFALQAGVGLPVLPAAIQGWRAKNVRYGPRAEAWFYGGTKVAEGFRRLELRNRVWIRYGNAIHDDRRLAELFGYFRCVCRASSASVTKPAKKKLPQEKIQHPLQQPLKT